MVKKSPPPSGRNKIIAYLKKNQKARVEDLRRHLSLSASIIHRHLKKLLISQQIIKIGRPPLVFYSLSPQKTTPPLLPKAKPQLVKFINENYLYISTSGQLLPGWPGFSAWVRKNKQEKQLLQLAQEFQSLRKQTNLNFNREGLIKATSKIKNTFPKCFLTEIYYADFYSLPKFGRTILGQKVLYAKSAQLPFLVQEIAQQVLPLIQTIIKKHQIRAVGFIPPTVPRKIQFLRELEYNLGLNLPQIKLAKAYPGQIPVAQKTLPKLEDRIDNAKKTIFIKDAIPNYQHILLIDDAIGSGATLNETAKKLRQYPSVKKVFGFAIVGSYKGFDVISEI